MLGALCVASPDKKEKEVGWGRANERKTKTKERWEKLPSIQQRCPPDKIRGIGEELGSE